MKYHAKIMYEGNFHYWWNHTKDGIIDKLVIPFVNGQVIILESKSLGKKLLNMKSVSTLTIYRTDRNLSSDSDGTPINKINSDDFKKNNCSEEIINEYKQDQIDQTRSVLQQQFSQVKDQVFIIMKFGDKELDSAYEGVIEPIIKEYDLTPIRVDKVQDSGKITDQIIEYITTSKYVIADLSGERPNTYYEAGFAHAIGKEIILSIKQNEKIHFDLSGHRFIQWETEADLRRQLRERFNNLIKSGME